MVLLQNCTDLVEAVPGLCSYTCLTPNDDEVIGIKVEVSDVKEEEDPLLISSAGNADDEVSYLFVHLFNYLASNPSYLSARLTVQFMEMKLLN